MVRIFSVLVEKVDSKMTLKLTIILQNISFVFSRLSFGLSSIGSLATLNNVITRHFDRALENK